MNYCVFLGVIIMTGKKLRSRLFGFKKSDVFAYICEMDEKTAAKLAEKDNEISELKEEIAELEKNREAIINVLQTAETNAKNMIDEDEMRAIPDDGKYRFILNKVWTQKD